MILSKNVLSGFCSGLLGLGLIAAPLALSAAENEAPAVGTAEREAIETVIKEYLLENPEILIEALNAYESNRRLAEAERQKLAVVENLDALTNDPSSPSIGNPDGDVVLVEFFDYRCGYCRASAPHVQAAIKSDPNLRVVMKEFPILSEESIVGARAALAAGMQGKYEEFHFALMNNSGDLSDGHLRRLANQLGIDADRMAEDMESDEVAEAIARNRALAQQLGINGTPAFIIGEELIPGAVELDVLLAKIAEVREKQS
jgi:protein-disulfide isomerase